MQKAKLIYNSIHMNKHLNLRFERRRAAVKKENDSVPHVPRNVEVLLNNLKSISDFYKRTGDNTNQNEIDMLITRIASKRSRINEHTFAFRHFPLSRMPQYRPLVEALIHLCIKAEQLEYPTLMMLEAAKERAKQRAIECVAEGVLPADDENYISLKNRINDLEHLAWL